MGAQWGRISSRQTPCSQPPYLGANVFAVTHGQRKLGASRVRPGHGRAAGIRILHLLGTQPMLVAEQRKDRAMSRLIIWCQVRFGLPTSNILACFGRKHPCTCSSVQ
jgi:hypothetical protein